MAKKLTVGQVAFQRHGFVTGHRVLVFIVRWWALTAKNGKEPANVEEFADFYGKSYPQCYREQAHFRQAFGMDTPSALAESLGYDVSSIRMARIDRVVLDLVAMVAR